MRVTKDQVQVLYLEANGFGRQIIWTDTVLRGVLGYGDGALPPRLLRRYRKISRLFAELADYNASLSYIADWRDAFCKSPQLNVEVCNINNLVHYGHCLLSIRSFDLIVVSHAAAGDDMTVLTKSAHWFDRRHCPMVVFLGNEYDLLDEKIRFVRDVEAEFLCTQLPLAAGCYLYGDLKQTRLVEMPHALNPQSYSSIGLTERDIDIGFVGDIYWPFVGDRERTELIQWFEVNGPRVGLSCDIRKQRVSRAEWNRFLNRCCAIIGAESGTYYLNEGGGLLNRARAYNLYENRSATFNEIFDRFYRDVPRQMSGKSISSRHFEPIGTKTCQILLEGEYNGILLPDVHYIAVKKDLSNIEDALGRYRDEGRRNEIVEEAYQHVLSHHTYAHRVERLIGLVFASKEKEEAIPETPASARAAGSPRMDI